MEAYRYSHVQNKETDLSSRQFIDHDIDWEDLLFSLQHVEVRILELIYLPEAKPYAFGMLCQRIKKIGCSTRTIRRKINKLEAMGLIHVVRSTIMIINPILKLQKNIKTLTLLWNHRDRNL